MSDESRTVGSIPVPCASVPYLCVALAFGSYVKKALIVHECFVFYCLVDV